MNTKDIYMLKLRVFSLFLLSISLLSSLGCGPKTGEVSGKITLKGKTPDLDGFQITFLGSDGKVAQGTIGRDGAYRVSGVTAGVVKIGLVVVGTADDEAAFHDELKPKDGKADPKQVEENLKKMKERDEKLAKSSGVPSKVRDPQTSGLVVTVESGRTATFDYDVK
jgi:hypothetical protein